MNDQYLDLSRLDIPLLEKGVDWVQEQAALPARRRSWSQARWVGADGCGTTYCVAGYIGQLLEEDFAASEMRWRPDGTHEHVATFAAAALGIPMQEHQYRDALSLFDARNTAEDVRRIADLYIELARAQGVV